MCACCRALCLSQHAVQSGSVQVFLLKGWIRRCVRTTRVAWSPAFSLPPPAEWPAWEEATAAAQRARLNLVRAWPKLPSADGRETMSQVGSLFYKRSPQVCIIQGGGCLHGTVGATTRPAQQRQQRPPSGWVKNQCSELSPPSCLPPTKCITKTPLSVRGEHACSMHGTVRKAAMAGCLPAA